MEKRNSDLRTLLLTDESGVLRISQHIYFRLKASRGSKNGFYQKKPERFTFCNPVIKPFLKPD